MRISRWSCQFWLVALSNVNYSVIIIFFSVSLIRFHGRGSGDIHLRKTHGISSAFCVASPYIVGTVKSRCKWLISLATRHARLIMLVQQVSSRLIARHLKIASSKSCFYDSIWMSRKKKGRHSHDVCNPVQMTRSIVGLHTTRQICSANDQNSHMHHNWFNKGNTRERILWMASWQSQSIRATWPITYWFSSNWKKLITETAQ